MQRLIGWIWGPSYKSLGRLEPREAEDSDRYRERKQNDCMPAMFLPEKPKLVGASAWITNHRHLPQVGKSKLGGV